MELELEGFFKRGIWVTRRTGTIGAKKKYALIGEDGKLKIRGFETVRRDWCNLAREIQNKVLKMILEDGNEKKALSICKRNNKKNQGKKNRQKRNYDKNTIKKANFRIQSNFSSCYCCTENERTKIPIDEGNLLNIILQKQEKKRSL